MAKKATVKYQEAQANEEEYLNAIADKMEDANLGVNIKVKKNGKIEKLTKENYADYLGMEVTNFKDLGAGTETVSVLITKYQQNIDYIILILIINMETEQERYT